MAQSGFTPILLYASNTASSTPSAGNLTNSANGAEVAVNTADKRLFTKNSGGSVVELGTNPSALAVAGTTTLSALTASTALALNASKEVVSVTNTGTGNNVLSASPTLTGTIGAAALTLSSDLTLSGGTANGVLYLNGSKVATSGSALTFASAGLDIASSGRVTNYGTGFVSGAGIELDYGVTANTGRVFTYDRGTSSWKTLQFGGDVITYNISGSEQMRLTSTGLGIGTSSPATKLQVTGGSIHVDRSVGGGASQLLMTLGASSGGNFGQISNTGTYWALGYGSSQSTVGTQSVIWDSSGNLGIGTSSPRTKLDVSAGEAIISNGTAGTASTGGTLWLNTGTSNSSRAAGIQAVSLGSVNDHSLLFYTNAASTAPTEKMRLDSAGNLGLGVTPSAWNSSRLALQIGGANGGYVTADNGLAIASNYAFVSGDKFVANGYAPLYFMSKGAGSHQWYISNNNSSGAGAAVSFTQAMTLDASGNLIGGGKTSASLTTAGFELTSDGSLRSTKSSTNTNLATNNGGSLQLANSSATDGNFSNIGAYNSNGLVVSQIDFINVSHASRTGDIAFLTHNGTSLTERARITSGGDLLVGTTTTNGKFNALNATGDASQPAGYFQNNKNFAGIAGVRFNSGNVFNDTGHQAFSFDESSTLRFEVRSNGGIANYSGNDVNLSDRREKTNFAPAKSYLDTICAIPVQTFNYIDQSPDDPGLTLGVVAQDVQAVAPELVMESNWGTEDNPKMRLSIYQTDLQYALMKCVQELKAELDATKARLAALEAQP